MKNPLLIKIIILITAIGIALIAVFQHGLYDKPDPKPIEQSQAKTDDSNKLEPQIVTTNPDPLENAVILPMQTIEITFNRPLENVGEFKNRIEPKPDYRLELSSDRKSAKIIPIKPFKLGERYNLFIQPDTKFDGHIELKRDYSYHFRTVEYKGV